MQQNQEREKKRQRTQIGIRAGKLGIALLVGFGLAGVSPIATTGGTPAAVAASTITPAFSDIQGHWGAATIQWAVERQIVSGYEDGTFKPNNPVSEPEFLAMLLRAYPDVQLPARGASEPWHAPYYTYAAKQGWPLIHSTDAKRYSRGRVAGIIAATQGVTGGERAAIAYLLEQKLAAGKSSNTIDGFEAQDALTRVEALQFIKNMVDKQLRVDVAVKPAPTQRERFTVRGIQIGDQEKDVIAQLGQPARRDVSEYGFQWYVYNRDYAQYVQVGIQNGRVVGLYTNAANWTTTDGVKPGTLVKDARKVYGNPIRLVKGNTIVTQQGDEANVFLIDDKYYATLFFDKHDQYKATAVQLIAKSVEDAQKKPYPAFSEALRTAYEKQIFDLATVSRARHGIAPLTWDDTIAGTARKHSRDMAERGYFDHDNLDGLSPFDRMKQDGIVYRAAAENIAAGQMNAIHAHAGWMNSKGHRVNILSEKVQRLGVGIHFGGEMQLYYTQNFYTPM